MYNQTGTTGVMSGGAKIVIGVIVAIIVIGGGVMLFSKDSEEVATESIGKVEALEKTETTSKTAKISGADQPVSATPATTKSAEVPAKSPTPAPTPAKTESYSSITTTKKAIDILATGKDTICTSRVIQNSGSSVKYQFSNGDMRIDTLGAGVEAHVILLKSGKSYQWSNMYEGVMTGGQYDVSARMFLQSPLFGYTCVEQDVSAGVFVPPAK